MPWTESLLSSPSLEVYVNLCHVGHDLTTSEGILGHLAYERDSYVRCDIRVITYNYNSWVSTLCNNQPVLRKYDPDQLFV